MSISDRTKHGRRLTVGLLGALVIGSCADLFGIAPSTTETGGSGHRESTGGRAEPPSQAGGGAGGLGGDDSAGASGAGDGGSDGGGPSSNGGTGGAGGTGGTSSGTGGMAPLFPRQGDPCSIVDLIACPSARATHYLKCDGETWLYGQGCGTHERCDRRTGGCATMLCETDMSTCLDNVSAENCGPDLVSLELELCDFTCVSDACAQPKTTEVFVDRQRAIQSLVYWPDPLIPVCVENPDAWTDVDIALVRSAFDANWGRYTSLALTGFGPCDAGSAGVSLSFATECDVELARIPRVGYPGPSALLPVTLCQSYRDSIGDLRPVDDVAVRRHANAHVFGHVLGLFDEPYASSSDVMGLGINLDPFEPPAMGAERIAGIQSIYGMKPSGSLLASSGRCLAPATDGSLAAREACDGSTERTFRLVAGRLEHVASGECLIQLTDDAVGLGACGSANVWDVPRAAWLTSGGRCISVRTFGDATRPLIAEDCSPQRANDQIWSFEFPFPGSARIRLERDKDRCVLHPISWSDPAPRLGDCDGQHDLFETAYGELSVSGRCLGVSNSTLEFAPCSGFYFQRFAVSGPIESGANALTLVGEGDEAELHVAPLVTPRAASQVFDYYFH